MLHKGLKKQIINKVKNTKKQSYRSDSLKNLLDPKISVVIDSNYNFLQSFLYYYLEKDKNTNKY